MKINKQYFGKITLASLLVGDLFEFDDNVYILTRAHYSNGSRVAVDLYTGETRDMLGCLRVTPLEGELKVKYR